MASATLVVLAAGNGTRFGGPKQLVPVRADGATITDVAIERAATAGITRAVVVVSDATAQAMTSHLATREHDVVVVRQGGTRGTAQALLAARGATSGPVVVVNADDVYPVDAYQAAAKHLDPGRSAGHGVIGFRLARTLSGTRPLSRALLGVDRGRLTGIREGVVVMEPVLAFTPNPATPGETVASPERLHGDELVSMNAMALQRDVFDRLESALESSAANEVFLPDVIADLVAEQIAVRVIECTGACHGLTYPEDTSTLASLL